MVSILPMVDLLGNTAVDWFCILSYFRLDTLTLYMYCTNTITSDMQGMVWGEPELSHVWEFDHMVFFHSHK